MLEKIPSVEMITRLVGFDTTSRYSNIQLIEFIKDYLESYQVPCNVIYNRDRTKANLHAVMGPENRSGVVLSGHTDVVPIDGQEWDSDPFKVTEKQGRLFGRGTADMKSFVAVALSAVPIIKKTKLTVPIHFAFSYDEEVGCLGAPDLITHIIEHGPLPLAVIVGEPTNMTVVSSHKGVYAYNTNVRGLEGHSSAPQKGVNAIFYATKLIGFLQELANDRRENPRSDSAFDPPYTSIHVGLVKGGTALNIIPRECSFVWEYRIIPDEPPNEIIERFNNYVESNILPQMQEVWESSSVETVRRSRIPPLLPAVNSSAETLAMALMETNNTYTVAYGTEAGLFQEADIPTVVCGPGSIDQAHKPNEFIELSQVKMCETFVLRLIQNLKQV